MHVRLRFASIPREETVSPCLERRIDIYSASFSPDTTNQWRSRCTWCYSFATGLASNTRCSIVFLFRSLRSAPLSRDSFISILKHLKIHSSLHLRGTFYQSTRSELKKKSTEKYIIRHSKHCTTSIEISTNMKLQRISANL